MPSIHAVPFALQLPPGAVGPDPVDSDVRCFLVPHDRGLLLVDAGLPGSADELTSALGSLSADWSDVTDVVVTHAHVDHVGGLAEVLGRAPSAALHAGAAEVTDVEAAAGRRPGALSSGDRVAGLRVVLAPGHTAGHLCLLDEDGGVLLAGDAVGALGGGLVRAPALFTADAVTAEQSLRELAALDVARLLTSHGPELADGPQRLQDLTRG